MRVVVARVDGLAAGMVVAPPLGRVRVYFFYLVPLSFIERPPPPPPLADPDRERDARLAVVDAEQPPVPAVVAQGEEEGAVAAAQVQEGGGRPGELRGRRVVVGVGVQEGQELGLGVRVVEPDRAFVCGVGGVVCQLCRVEGVPAF